MVLEKVTHTQTHTYREHIYEREVLENALELYIIKKADSNYQLSKEWEFCN